MIRALRKLAATGGLLCLALLVAGLIEGSYVGYSLVVAASLVGPFSLGLWLLVRPQRRGEATSACEPEASALTPRTGQE